MITLTELMERRDKIFNAGDLPGATDNEFYAQADDLSKRSIIAWNVQNENGITMDYASYLMSIAETRFTSFLYALLDSEIESRLQNENL
jgi:hypothetical protein